MGVAEGDHRDAGAEVEITSPLGVEEVDPLTPPETNGPFAVGGHQSGNHERIPLSPFSSASFSPRDWRKNWKYPRPSPRCQQKHAALRPMAARQRPCQPAMALVLVSGLRWNGHSPDT